MSVQAQRLRNDAAAKARLKHSSDSGGSRNEPRSEVRGGRQAGPIYVQVNGQIQTETSIANQENPDRRCAKGLPLGFEKSILNRFSG